MWCVCDAQRACAVVEGCHLPLPNVNIYPAETMPSVPCHQLLSAEVGIVPGTEGVGGAYISEARIEELPDDGTPAVTGNIFIQLYSHVYAYYIQLYLLYMMV